MVSPPPSGISGLPKYPWEYTEEEILEATDFWLDPQEVRLQAGAFDSFDSEAGAAAATLRNLDLNSQPGFPLYDSVAATAESVQDAVAGWFGHLQACMAGAAIELRAIADEGEGQDLDASARLDALDPVEYLTEREPMFKPGASSPQASSQSPGIAPAEARVGSSQVEKIYQGAAFHLDPGLASWELNNLPESLMPGGVFGLSDHLQAGLKLAGKEGLIEELAKIFSGSWGDLRRFADVLESGEAGAVTLAESLRQGANTTAERLDIHWQGYAANSAQQYFSEMSGSVYTGIEIIRDAASPIRDLVDAVQSSVDAITGLLRDMALMAAASVLAKTGGAMGQAPAHRSMAGCVELGIAGRRSLYLDSASPDGRRLVQESPIIRRIEQLQH